MTSDDRPVSVPAFDNKGVIYEIPARAEHSAKHYMKALTRQEDRRFLLAVIDFANEYGLQHDKGGELVYLLDSDQLSAAAELHPATDVKTGRSTINSRLKRLLSLGVFTREFLIVEGIKGKRYKYELLPADLVLANAQNDSRREFNNHRTTPYRQALREQRQQMIDLDAQLLEPPKQLQKAHSERLFNNVFFSCGRLGTRDPRRDKIITHYKFRDEQIVVTATSGGDAALFSLDDQTTVLAIITLVIFCNEERMRKGQELRNDYYLDVAHVCSICGLPPNGANRKTVRDSIDRLYHSNLNIQCPTDSEFAKYFGLTSFTDANGVFTPDNMDIRFLWRRDSASMEKELSKHRLPRLYRITLHPLIFNQLSDPEIWNTFVVNPALLQNRFGMINHLYFFAARTIARVPGKVRNYTMRAVQQMIMPAVERYDNWQRSLFTELEAFAEKTNQKWVDGEAVTLDIYGYMVKLQPNRVHGYMMTFWFNEDDPFLGKNGLIQKMRDLAPVSQGTLPGMELEEEKTSDPDNNAPGEGFFSPL